jgi:Glycosyl transferase family 2
MLVCGCGESLNELSNPERFITIGVNDVGRRFDPNYLVVVNPRAQFVRDRFHYVETSRAEYIFTQFDSLGISHPNIVKFRLGSYGGTNFSNPDVLHYSNNSPYVALCLAVHMGAKRIGLIGVDFTDHHFFAATGRHPLVGSLPRIDTEYRQLGAALAELGVEIVNLSRQSRLTAFPKCDTLLRQNGRSETHPMNIVSYATTPVAGVPAILARCIVAETSHRARCVWATSSYGNGVVFNGDIEWTKSPAEAKKELDGADVVIVHNGKVASQHRRIIDSKPVITMAHNYRWNVDCHYVDKGLPGVVVGQYQASLPEFRGWNVVPNPIPLWEPEYKPEEKPMKVAIAFTPSGKHERFLSTDRLYWHSKGYTTTMAVLDRLAKSYPLQLEVIRNAQVSHGESLAMKRRAHIVIDECVTGSYHRNSLEGLATGCVVLNGMHLRIGVIEAFRTCAEIGGADTPFVYADLCSLERVLISLIEKGPSVLSSMGRANHEWMKSHWDFSKQWPRFWAPIVEVAFEVHPSKKPSANTFEPPHLVCSKRLGEAHSCARRQSEALSVVIPHGGDDRLPVLKHALKTLKVYSDIGEVIVVEMGTQPNAKRSIDGLCDHYVFIQEAGVFHKARAINAGLSIASKELVAWIDNDLIVPPGFLDCALRELTDRKLDCLTPWNTVRFLSKADTAKVLEGKLDYREAHQLNSLESGKGNRGGAVLVRREFACSCRGVREEFRGWGGEDDAWFYMAEQLGKAAVTSRRDQHLFHLYHDRSSGYPPHDPLVVNPEYPNNLATIRRMQRLRGKEALLGEFPIAEHFRLPWDAQQQMGILRDENNPVQMEIAARIRVNMFEIYGVEITEYSAGNITPCDFLVVLDLAALPLVVRNSHSGAVPVLGSWNYDQALSLPVYARVRHIIMSDAVAPKKLELGNAKLITWRESEDNIGAGMGLIQRIVEIASFTR